MEVYIVITEDTHTDVSVEVFKHLIDARERVAEIQDLYGDKYEWQVKVIKGWAYYVRTYSDCVSIRIEKKKLKEMRHEKIE